MPKIKTYCKLLRLHQPIGMLLLLWPTLWALWIAASGPPKMMLLLTFILGTALMRSAGCAINDWADADFDGQVERTKSRPIPQGSLPRQHALICAAILFLSASSLLFFTNTKTQGLALIGALFAITYPFFKRFFPLPQLYLGLSFGWGIPMAFMAVNEHIPPVAWTLFTANIFWVLAYDTAYAMADKKDDEKLGLYSSAILFGELDTLMVSVFYAASIALLFGVGKMAQLGHFYDASLLLVIAISIYHTTLIRTRKPADCFKAFKQNSWIGATVFSGIALDFFLR